MRKETRNVLLSVTVAGTILKVLATKLKKESFRITKEVVKTCDNKKVEELYNNINILKMNQPSLKNIRKEETKFIDSSCLEGDISYNSKIAIMRYRLIELLDKM